MKHQSTACHCCYCLVTKPCLLTPWTVRHQASLSVGFPRQEYWSGLPLPSLGVFLPQGWNAHLLHWQVGSLAPREPQYHSQSKDLSTPSIPCLVVKSTGSSVTDQWNHLEQIAEVSASISSSMKIAIGDSTWDCSEK